MLSASRKHLMIDIETLGTRPGSVIIQIAAAVFSPLDDGYGETFKINVDPKSCLALGLTHDQKTIDWWESQGPEVKKSVFAAGVPVKEAITEFSRWIGKNAPSPVVWAHGATFDPVLLQWVFTALELRTPWSHLDCRDTRTIFDLVGLREINQFRDDALMKHDALADVVSQIKAIQYSFGRIGVDNS